MINRWKYWRAVEVIERMPEHYRRYLFELENKPPKPVHYIEDPVKYKADPVTGEVKRYENRPIAISFPKECHNGLWGGEGIIKGFTKKKPMKRRVPNYWIPSLRRGIVYSEILDKVFSVVVTNRTLELIDEAYGFDNYILKTHPVDLRSQLAMDLRRKMLLTLIRKEMYPDDKQKQNEIYEKYKQYLIPEEEAEWHGLRLIEAIKKQLQIEEIRDKPVPLKIKYRKEFIAELQDKKQQKAEEEVSSWMQTLNPFSKSKKQSETTD